MKNKQKLSLLAEPFIGNANGVYTAFLEAKDTLIKSNQFDISINSGFKDADLIHAHSIGLQYLKLGLKYKHKMIVSAHVVPDSFIGSLIFSKLWRPIAKLYLKLAFNLASQVIAVSPTVKTALEKIGVRTPITVLCNSVDREKFKPNPEARELIRKKHHIKDSAFVATSVGQIQPRKGIYEFLDTARLCPEITFLWVGGRPYGRLTADYQKLTKAVEEAPDNVIFSGIIPFEDMPSYYAASDVYFLPSWQENFAFATIEAAACKLPLLLRDNPEYENSLFTHYLKALDVEAYANFILALNKDHLLLKKWQQQSDILAGKYESEAYIKRLLECYQTLQKKGS